MHHFNLLAPRQWVDPSKRVVLAPGANPSLQHSADMVNLFLDETESEGRELPTLPRRFGDS